MKKLTIALSLFAYTTTFAADVCIARKNHDIGYGSTMNYIVKCSDGKNFETRKIVTTVLLPLPYNWGKVAKKRLYREMSELGYTEVAQFKPVIKTKIHDGTPIHFFEKSDTGATYCSVIKYNQFVAGLHHEKIIFDVVITCEDPLDEWRFFGIMQSELDEITQNHGYTKVLEDEYNLEFETFQGGTVRGKKKIEIYRSR